MLSALSFTLVMTQFTFSLKALRSGVLDVIPQSLFDNLTEPSVTVKPAHDNQLPVQSTHAFLASTSLSILLELFSRANFFLPSRLRPLDLCR